MNTIKMHAAIHDVDLHPMRWIWLFCLVLLAPWQQVAGQAGSIDATFSIGTGANGRVFGMASQNNGKQVIVGAFTDYNGTVINRVARINRSGALDGTFTVGTGANGQVNAVVIDGSGKILIGGSFTDYNGTTLNKIARLNSNGTLDGTFSIGTGFAGGNVNAIAVQADGKILVVGTFTSYNGTTENRIVRLNTNGTRDVGYVTGTGTNSDIYHGALDVNGKFVIGGTFSTYNGTSSQGVARINTNGTIDGTLSVGTGTNNAVFCIGNQPDGKIVIGGLFTTYNGTSATRIARLTSTGALDGTFSTGTGFNSWPYVIAFQPDGKILIGGDFMTYNGVTRNRMVRLNTNGTLDTGFTTGTTFNNWVYAIAYHNEGRVTVAGGFTSYNGSARNRLIRLSTGCTETLQLTINTNGAGAETSWEIQPEGFAYAACSGSGYGNFATAVEQCCVADGCYRLRVFDSAGDGMGSGGYMLTNGSGARIIDNLGDGVFTNESSIAGGGVFCVPMSTDRVITYDCDKLDFLPNNYMVASEIPAVSAQFGVGDQTDDGYEFWFFDPDGTYSVRKFRSHATSDGYGVNELRACHKRLSWTPAVDPIPTGVKLNVRVRGRVNGVNNAWGPACTFKVDAAYCPLSRLMDIPGNRYFSCGVTRSRKQYVTALPVLGATKYDFEFVNTADSYSYTIQSNNYHRYLNWASPALLTGHTYDVRVRVSLDNGATWCPWGETCTITISASMLEPNGGLSFADVGGDQDIQVWPNPNAGDRMELLIPDLDENDHLAEVTVYGSNGQCVHEQRFGIEAPEWRTKLEFSNTLDQGHYIIQVRVGEKSWHQRFVVTR
ncbi:MAG: T9SS type A sorting domain-containing protein [Flavobacteriales bacterium]|nr:T9SS type A sorting domain-containing protein [Flavobacteriales bacterium]